MTWWLFFLLCWWFRTSPRSCKICPTIIGGISSALDYIRSLSPSLKFHVYM